MENLWAFGSIGTETGSATCVTNKQTRRKRQIVVRIVIARSQNLVIIYNFGETRLDEPVLKFFSAGTSHFIHSPIVDKHDSN